MNLHVARCAAGLLWPLAAVLIAGEATAHGGLSMEKDYCKLRIGPYVMHFTGYQPGDGYRKEFCEDIPSTGATIVVLDFIDDVLRDLPVALRIIRDDGGGQDLDSATVYHVPPEDLPDGNPLIRLSIPTAGKLRRACYRGRQKSTSEWTVSLLGRGAILSTVFISGGTPRHRFRCGLRHFALASRREGCGGCMTPVGGGCRALWRFDCAAGVGFCTPEPPAF